MIPMTATAVRKRHHDYARARRAGVAVLAAAAVSLIGAASAPAQLQSLRTDTVPGEVIVQFDSGTSGAERADVRDAAGTRVEEALRQPGLQRLSVEPGTTVDGGHPPAGGRPGRPIRAAEHRLPSHRRGDPTTRTWVSSGDSRQIGAPAGVGLDDGLAQRHRGGARLRHRVRPPDFGSNIDRRAGRDFVDTPGDPVNDTSDLNGHGTHVAGTIAAEGDNGIGIAGVTWHSKLVPVRVLNGNGEGTTAQLAQGLDYAGDIGAQVANVSTSGSGVDPAVAQAITSHPGTLYVVAAGNEASNNDADPQTPCNVAAPNLICVAATTETDGARRVLQHRRLLGGSGGAGHRDPLTSGAADTVPDDRERLTDGTSRAPARSPTGTDDLRELARGRRLRDDDRRPLGHRIAVRQLRDEPEQRA